LKRFENMKLRNLSSGMHVLPISMEETDSMLAEYERMMNGGR
jgi:hypothetical protein